MRKATGKDGQGEHYKQFGYGLGENWHLPYCSSNHSTFRTVSVPVLKPRNEPSLHLQAKSAENPANLIDGCEKFYLKSDDFQVVKNESAVKNSQVKEILKHFGVKMMLSEKGPPKNTVFIEEGNKYQRQTAMSALFAYFECLREGQRFELQSFIHQTTEESSTDTDTDSEDEKKDSVAPNPSKSQQKPNTVSLNKEREFIKRGVKMLDAIPPLPLPTMDWQQRPLSRSHQELQQRKPLNLLSDLDLQFDQDDRVSTTSRSYNVTQREALLHPRLEAEPQAEKLSPPRGRGRGRGIAFSSRTHSSESSKWRSAWNDSPEKLINRKDGKSLFGSDGSEDSDDRRLPRSSLNKDESPLTSSSIPPAAPEKAKESIDEMIARLERSSLNE